MNSKYQKLIISFIYVLTMTAIVWLLNGQSLLGIDDANIYFVYMRNLADGYGFVYNIGSERVEGFTSLLWTLIGSFFYLITRTPQIFFLMMNIIIITYTFWKVILYLDYTFGSDKALSPVSILLMGLVAVYPGFFEWTVLSLMETGLWSFLLILTMLNILRFNTLEKKNRLHWEFNLMIVLLILCRPEAIVWGALFIGIRIHQLITNEVERRQRIRNIIFCLGIFIAIQLLLLIWREIYFGYPLPNTFYAKMSGNIFTNIISGSNYLFRFLLDSPAALLSFIVSMFAIMKLKSENKVIDSYPILYLISAFIITMIIPLYTGGDHFNLSRFIQPTVPLIWLLIIVSLKTLKIDIFKIKYVIVILLFLLFTGETSWIKINIEGKRFLSHEWRIAEFGQKASNELNSFFNKLPKLPSQGVGIAGATAYYYHGFTYDLLGLNNTKMAHAPKSGNFHIMKNHQSFNKTVFLRQQPDLFFMGGAFIDQQSQLNFKGLIVIPFIRNIYKNIIFDKDFQSQYSNVLIRRMDFPDALAIFASNRFLRTLDTNIYKVEIYPHFVGP